MGYPQSLLCKRVKQRSFGFQSENGSGKDDRVRKTNKTNAAGSEL